MGGLWPEDGFLNPWRQGRADLPNLRQILQVSETCFGGDPRQFDRRVQRWPHRRRQLSGLAAIVQELTVAITCGGEAKLSRSRVHREVRPGYIHDRLTVPNASFSAAPTKRAPSQAQPSPTYQRNCRPAIVINVVTAPNNSATRVHAFPTRRVLTRSGTSAASAAAATPVVGPWANSRADWSGVHRSSGPRIAGYC